MRKKISIINATCVVFLLLAVLTSAFFTKDRTVPVETADSRLLKRSSPSPVDPNREQVLIYRSQGLDRPRFTAMGTLINTQSGPIIVTVENLLMREFEGSLFFFYGLPSAPKIGSVGIESLAPLSANVVIPEDLDVVFLKVGKRSPLPVLSEKKIGIRESHSSLFVGGVRIDGLVVSELTSLLSGEKHPVMGALKSPRRILISYDAEYGEAGAGFVDEHGRLYLLDACLREETVSISSLTGPVPTGESISL